MRRFSYDEACDYLNYVHGYIDVQNDEDYSREEVIKIAEAKFKEGKICTDEHELKDMKKEQRICKHNEYDCGCEQDEV